MPIIFETKMYVYLILGTSANDRIFKVRADCQPLKRRLKQFLCGELNLYKILVW